MSRQALILFAHGARNPQWREPLERLRALLVARAPALRVEVAFLELLEPVLADAIDMVVAAGARDITVVPVFIARSGHLLRDVPPLLDAARERHPGCTLRMTEPVGESDIVLAAMADYALAETDAASDGAS